MDDREREEFYILSEAVGLLLRDYIRQERNHAAADEARGLLDEMVKRGMIGREEEGEQRA